MVIYYGAVDGKVVKRQNGNVPNISIVKILKDAFTSNDFTMTLTILEFSTLLAKNIWAKTYAGGACD